MVEVGSIILGFVVVLSGLFRTFLKPKFDQAGFFRNGINNNTQHCSTIGLPACEDIWLHQASGLAYLACGNRTQRAHWETGLGILQAEKLSPHSSDYITILDLKTHEHRRVELINLPGRLKEKGIYVHGIDLFISPIDPSEGSSIATEQVIFNDQVAQKATIYLVNHLPPSDPKSSHLIGADSVIEVFDTVLGDTKATYRTTIKHDLVLTPNNLVGLSESSFYVTNDHNSKVSWTRSFEPFLVDSEINAIIFCSFTEDDLNCMPALSGKYPHPNGIAKGPEDSLYMVTTYDPHLRRFDMQSDHSLVLVDELKLPRVVDNIFVTPQGSIFLAGIPSIFKFKKLLIGIQNNNFDLVSPSDIWKISNETATNAFFGGRLKIEQVLSDDGKKINGATGVAVWNSKLYITGLASPHISVCKIDENLAM